MSKRGAIGEITNEDKSKPVKISKPSLDSDEEDYQENDCFRLRDADIEGQECETVEYDEDIKITPFNMREELEEDGYIDGTGNFVFKKVLDARDNWLEHVDWVEVNRKQRGDQPKDTSISDEGSKKPMSSTHKLELYKQLVCFMRPRETVLRSIKRMGSVSNSTTSASASQRWLKKKKKNEQEPDEQASTNANPEGLIRATELADQLLQVGEFDVYQMTHEAMERVVQAQVEQEPEDELDALGKALDTETKDPSTEKSANESSSDQAIMWQLKRMVDGQAPSLEGPYTTEQLRQWVDEDKFNDAKTTVLVRQTDKPNGQFYNVKRIDFELYE